MVRRSIYQEKAPLHDVASLEYRCGDIEGSLPPISHLKAVVMEP
jgi:hypothetical protein